MKYSLFLLPFFLFSIVLANEMGTAPSVQQVATRYLDTGLEYIVTFDELGAVLANVNDKLTAEQAVPQTRDVLERLKKLRDQELELPTPAPEVAEYVQKELAAANMAEIQERSIGKVLDLLTLADPPCYGSTELTGILLELTDVLTAEH